LGPLEKLLLLLELPELDALELELELELLELGLEVLDELELDDELLLLDELLLTRDAQSLTILMSSSGTLFGSFCNCLSSST
jgi:hypothetical protein